MEMKVNEIGGGIVRRTFSRGGDRLIAGDRLTGDDIRAMPSANRRALVSGGYIDIYPSGEVADSKLEKENAKLRAHVSELETANGELLDRLTSLKQRSGKSKE